MCDGVGNVFETVHSREKETYSALYFRSCIPGSPAAPSPFEVDEVEDATLSSQVLKETMAC
jgi:hypothetical protein